MHLDFNGRVQCGYNSIRKETCEDYRGMLLCIKVINYNYI